MNKRIDVNGAYVDTKPIYGNEGRKVCKNCGDYFSRIGQHWSNGNCKTPRIDDDQEEMIWGMLLGDGYMFDSNDTGRFQFGVKMINKTFIKWLQEKYMYLFLERVEKIDSDNKWETSSMTEGYNIHDKYKISTHSMSTLNKYSNWYDQKKRCEIIRNIEPSPTMVKMWFCSDGWVSNRDQQFPTTSIAITFLDKEHRNAIVEFLNSTGIDYSIYSGKRGDQIKFNGSQSQQLYEYMGDAPPGFEYKWPDGPTYDEAKKTHITKTVNGESVPS